MAEFLEVARLDQVPSGSGSSFTVAGKDVAVFNVNGTLRDGGFLSAQGIVAGRWPTRR
jgi:hypothetical protein